MITRLQRRNNLPNEAEDEVALGPLLDKLTANPAPTISEAASQFAEPELIKTIRDFIYNGKAYDNS